MAYDTTKAIYLLKLFEVLEERACPTAPIRELAGIDERQLDDREGSIPLPLYIEALEHATRQYDIPDLGFLVGEHTTPLEHGVLGYALLSSRDLRESLRRYVRYQHLQGPLLTISLAESGATASLTAQPIYGRMGISAGALRYIVQEWLVGWNQWCPIIHVSGSFFQHVRLAYAADRQQRYYEEHLACTVSFGNSETTGVFPADYLDRTLEYADESIAALCSVQCERLLDVLNRRAGLIAEVHRQLVSSPGHVPSMEVMADKLRIGVRTLRRRLKNEGTTYQNVVTEFRIAMAQRYLTETTLPANEISVLVGYADPANLYRVFQKDTGLTPQRYREQHAG